MRVEYVVPKETKGSSFRAVLVDSDHQTSLCEMPAPQPLHPISAQFFELLRPLPRHGNLLPGSSQLEPRVPICALRNESSIQRNKFCYCRDDPSSLCIGSPSCSTFSFTVPVRTPATRLVGWPFFVASGAAIISPRGLCARWCSREGP